MFSLDPVVILSYIESKLIIIISSGSMTEGEVEENTVVILVWASPQWGWQFNERPTSKKVPHSPIPIIVSLIVGWKFDQYCIYFSMICTF